MNTKKIKYIGKRSYFTDNIYGTGLTWEKGDIISIPLKEANLLLRHKDVFESVSNDSEVLSNENISDIDVNETDKTEEYDEEAEIARASVMQMNRKASLVDFAKENFSIELETGPNVTVSSLREQCVNLIDQYGLP